MTDLEAFNALSACFVNLERRVACVEQQVANQALETRRLKGELNPHLYPDPAALKSQAAQQQATCGNSRGPLKTYDIKREPIKEQAAQQQAQGTLIRTETITSGGLYAPLRSDTKPLIDLAAFARRLLNPDDLGHAVTHEVRNAARRALGMPEVREYDL